MNEVSEITLEKAKELATLSDGSGYIFANEGLPMRCKIRRRWWLVYTNGAAMLAVRGLGDAEWIDNERAIPAQTFVDSIDLDEEGESVDVAALKAWLGPHQKKEMAPCDCGGEGTNCKSCDGVGDNESSCDDCGHWHACECRACNGIGRACDECHMTGEVEKVLSKREGFIRWRLISRNLLSLFFEPIQERFCEVIDYDDKGGGRGLIFKGRGWFIVVMCITRSDSKTHPPAFEPLKVTS